LFSGNNSCVVSSHFIGDIRMNQPINKPNKSNNIFCVWTLVILIFKHFVNNYNYNNTKMIITRSKISILRKTNVQIHGGNILIFRFIMGIHLY